jgi:hypothetical protein
MRFTTISISAVTALGLLTLAGGHTDAAVPGTVSGCSLPAALIENAGQWDTPARFVGRYGPVVARFEPGAIVLQINVEGPDDRVTTGVTRLVFEGARNDVVPEGDALLPGRYSYFTSRDPARWRTDVPSYRQVVYRGLYDGVDLRVRESGGLLEYDLLVAPGADPSQVVIRAEGTERLNLDDGELILQTAVGSIRQQAPITWYALPDGSRHLVESRFCIIDETRYGFEVPDATSDLALVIDPKLEWSTYLGGASSDWVGFPNGVHLASGEVFVTGVTWSGNFPTTTGAFQEVYGTNRDAYVAVLDPSLSGAAQLLYCTYLGGDGEDGGWAIHTDSQGRIVVAGNTESANFPVTGDAYDATLDGVSDAWVAVVDPSLVGAAQLVYSTYLGSTGAETSNDVAVDASDAILVLGATTEVDFPTTAGAYNETYNGGSTDAFVTRLDPTAEGPAQLVDSTYLGTFGSDSFKNMAIDATGNVVIFGDIRGSDFPATPGAWDLTYNGGLRDGAIAKLDPTLSTLLAATYFGGLSDDNGNAMAIEPSGNIAIAGWTTSFDLPFTIDAYDTTSNGGFDIYVARLDPTLSTVLACTYIGGPLNEGANGLSVDSVGNVTVTGTVNSLNYPTTAGALSPGHNGGDTDAFVTRFDAGLSTLRYSSYLGGSGNSDFGYVVEDDESGVVTVGGLTTSTNFPVTADAFDPTPSGGNDAFITQLPHCPWDCAGDNDGVVTILEFLTLLAQWGMIGTSCDIGGDGADILDFLEILAHWGPCP